MSALVTGVIAGWFANKVFGPSVDAMGKNLAAHLQSRMPAIFGRAEQIAKQAGIEPEPIKPGLLSRMIVDASFSEDTDEITEWWANLFVSASTHADNKHAVFSDIMATLGPAEARVLSDFVTYYEVQLAKFPEEYRDKVGEVGPLLQERLLTKILEKFPLGPGVRREVDMHLANPEIPLPVRTFAWSLPEGHEQGESTWSLTTEKWYSQDRLSIEILERERVFRFARVDVPLMANTSSWIDLVELTALGMEFYRACTGASLKDNKQ